MPTLEPARYASPRLGSALQPAKRSELKTPWFPESQATAARSRQPAVAVWAEEGITQSELVECCHCEPPTVTKALSRMQRAGLLERRRDTADGRVSRVYLTRRGRGLQSQVVERWKELDRQTFAGLDASQRRQLRGMLGRMLANLS